MNQTSDLPPSQKFHSSNLSNLSISIFTFNLMATTQKKDIKREVRTFDACDSVHGWGSVPSQLLKVLNDLIFSSGYKNSILQLENNLWTGCGGLGPSEIEHKNASARLGDYPYYFASRNAHIMLTYWRISLSIGGFADKIYNFDIRDQWSLGQIFQVRQGRVTSLVPCACHEDNVHVHNEISQALRKEAACNMENLVLVIKS